MCQLSKRYGDLNYESRGSDRSCDKTSYWILKLGPGFFELLRLDCFTFGFYVLTLHAPQPRHSLRFTLFVCFFQLMSWKNINLQLGCKSINASCDITHIHNTRDWNDDWNERKVYTSRINHVCCSLIRHMLLLRNSVLTYISTPLWITTTFEDNVDLLIDPLGSWFDSH